MTLIAKCRMMLGLLATQTVWVRRHARNRARRSAKELQYWKMRTTSSAETEARVPGDAAIATVATSELPGRGLTGWGGLFRSQLLLSRARRNGSTGRYLSVDTST